MSLLETITHVGYAPREPGDVTGAELPDGTVVTAQQRVQRLPALELGYTDFELAHRQLQRVTAPQQRLPDRGLGVPELRSSTWTGAGRASWRLRAMATATGRTMAVVSSARRGRSARHRPA